MTPGALIRQTRKDKGMTQHQLAAASGVTREWLASLEKDRISSPGMNLLAKLARGLDMPAAELISLLGLTPSEPLRLDPEVNEEIQRFVKLVSELDQFRREAVVAYMTSINRLLGAETDRLTASTSRESTTGNQSSSAGASSRKPAEFRE